MDEQPTALILCFNEDTSRWFKVRVPVPGVGQKPNDEDVRAALLRRGLTLGQKMEFDRRAVDAVCMVETTEERAQRLKRRRQRLLERELDIDLAGWRK